MYPWNISDRVGWPNARTTAHRARASKLHAIFPGFAYTQRIFWTKQVLLIRKKIGNNKWKFCICLRSNFRRRVWIKSNVLKLSIEQHVRENNFGQTCRIAECQVLRSRSAPEILMKIMVREARARYSQNERNQSNVETSLLCVKLIWANTIWIDANNIRPHFSSWFEEIEYFPRWAGRKRML